MPIEGGSGASRNFLNLGFSPLSLEAVMELLAARGDQTFEYIVTPNVDHVVRLASAHGAAFLDAPYRGAFLRLCDSRILATLARLCGQKLEVVPGSDLTAHLFRDTIGAGDRIAIVGGNSQTLERLRKIYPSPVFLHHVPPMGMLGDNRAQEAAIDFVEQSQARFVFLAVGAPQSEVLAERLKKRGEATGTGLCIGASIEFLTGEKVRAPGWIQKAGLEWAHRLLTEPRRLWKRYLVEGPAIFGIVLRWRLSGRTPWSIMPSVGSDPARLGLADQVGVNG